MASQPPKEETESPLPPGTWDAQVLAEAAEQSKTLRALFVNQLFVQPDGRHLRLTFGERVQGEPIFHTSFVVPNSDALEFGELVVKMAQAALDQQMAEMKQALSDEMQAPIDGE